MGDKRLVGIMLFLIGSALLGVAISRLPQSFVTGHQHSYDDSALSPSYWRTESVAKPPAVNKLKPPVKNVSGALDPQTHVQVQQQNQALEAFNDAVTLMQYRHYEAAIVKWHQFLESFPNVIEAHVNLGYAFVGLEQWDYASAAFEHALSLSDNQANAYYGLALVAEARGNLRLAREYMQTFLHLEHDTDYDNKATAALWQWNEQLKPDYVTVNDDTSE